MKSFIVIGLGRFGMSVARELAKLGNEVLVIDNDEDKIDEIAEYVTHAMIADACDEAVLKSVGVRNFDCCVVTVGGSLEASVLITLALKDLGANYVVCKAKSETHKRILEQIGATRVVVPEWDMGRHLAGTLDNSHIIDYIELSSEYSIIQLTPPGSWIDRSIAQSNVRARYGITIIGVRRGDDFTISPPADYVIDAEDVLVIVGDEDAIDKVRDEP